MMRGKRGQLTLFVILGVLIIVISILASLFLFGGDLDDDGSLFGNNNEKTRAQEYIEECVEEEVVNSLGALLVQGGEIDLGDEEIFYELKDVKYLCYTEETEELCVNLEPMLISNTEEDVRSAISSGVETCFDKLVESYSAYAPTVGETSLEIDILPGKITVYLLKDITLHDGEDENYYDDFSFDIVREVYNLLRIAQKIIDEEISCECGEESCNADLADLMGENYGFSIEKDLVNDQSEVYSIEDNSNGDEFVFAIKNCVKEI
jgi:hypothetical protein